MVWDPSYLQPLLASHFSLWCEAPEKKLALSNQPKIHFWSTFELSHVKIFFGASRQSSKKTLLMVIWGKGVQKLIFMHFWREAPKEKILTILV